MDDVHFERSEVFESQFLRRYNRKLEIHKGLILKTPTKIDRVIVKIKSPKGKEYKLIDKLNDEQLTEYAFAIEGDKIRRYRTYLEAEIDIADRLGGE